MFWSFASDFLAFSCGDGILCPYFSLASACLLVPSVIRARPLSFARHNPFTRPFSPDKSVLKDTINPFKQGLTTL